MKIYYRRSLNSSLSRSHLLRSALGPVAIYGRNWCRYIYKHYTRRLWLWRWRVRCRFGGSEGFYSFDVASSKRRSFNSEAMPRVEMAVSTWHRDGQHQAVYGQIEEVHNSQKMAGKKRSGTLLLVFPCLLFVVLLRKHFASITNRKLETPSEHSAVWPRCPHHAKALTLRRAAHVRRFPARFTATWTVIWTIHAWQAWMRNMTRHRIT